MPAHDACEPQVIRALQKAGWEIVVRPAPIRMEDKRIVFADLLLQQSESERQVIIIEVKCFSRKSVELDQFYQAVGQYLFYRNALAIRNVYTPLYLAIPTDVHNTLFQRPPIQATIKDAKIKIVVVHLVDERVTQWID